MSPRANAQDLAKTIRSIEIRCSARANQFRNVDPIDNFNCVQLMSAENTLTVPVVSDGVGSHEGETFTNIPDDYYVGPEGCGPCVGLIIVSPPDENGQITVWVYHLSAEDEPYKTLNNSGIFPPGSTAYLNGGDNTDTSNGTLQSVNKFLTGNKNLTVGGYFNAPALYVNNKGELFTTAGALSTQDHATYPE